MHVARDTLKILNGTCDVVQLNSHKIDLISWNNSHYRNIISTWAFEHSFHLNEQGHAGHTLAMTRTAYEQLGGIYERKIIGGGDWAFFNGFLKDPKNGGYKAVTKYHQQYQDLRLGYVPGILIHGFHGYKKNRKYCQREELCKQYKYDPTVHVTQRNDGLLIPSKFCPPGLVKGIMKYFSERNEDEGNPAYTI
jgi:hypothetical protein